MEFAILDFLQQLHNPVLDTLMKIITSLGNDGILYYAMIIALLIPKKTRKLGFVLGIAILFNWLISNVTLKPLVARIRPYNVNTAVEILIHKPSSYSFPSGHTAQAFTAAFAFLFAKSKLTKPMFILAILIGFSRLYFYVHYPTDVLGGVLTGCLSAYLAYITIKSIEKKMVKSH